MTRHITNKLEIICEDEKTMDKIRTMIFDVDEKNNRIFTMSKLLPKPPEYSASKGHNEYCHYEDGFLEYGYDWNIAIWGTKWDVYDYRIIDSGNTITIYYATAMNPNEQWLEFICRYIQISLIFLESEETPFISVKLHYYDYVGEWGGTWEWVPFMNPIEKRYSILEYAKLHDKGLYDWVSLIYEYNSLENHQVAKNDNESKNEDFKNPPFRGEDIIELPSIDFHINPIFDTVIPSDFEDYSLWFWPA